MSRIKFSVEKSTSWILILQVIAISFLVSSFIVPRLFSHLEYSSNEYWIYFSGLSFALIFIISVMFTQFPEIFFLFNISASALVGGIAIYFNGKFWSLSNEEALASSFIAGLLFYFINRKSYQHMIIEDTTKHVPILKS